MRFGSKGRGEALRAVVSDQWTMDSLQLSVVRQELTTAD